MKRISEPMSAKTRSAAMFLIASIGMLLLAAGCKKKSPTPIEIKQPIKLKLTKTTDGLTPLSDSVYFHFNKKITVNSFRSLYTLCVPANQEEPVYVDDHHGFKVKYPCASLGMTFPFEYSVTDEEGETLIDTVEISYYTKKFSLQDASIPNMVVTDDNKSVWLTTITDNMDRFRLLKIDLGSFEVKIDVAIPDIPANLTINPYNHLIYICSNYNKPQIFVLSPEDGHLVKTIEMKPIPGDNEVYPNLNPGNLIFTRSGFGVLNAGYGWKVLDSSKNDTIYYHKDTDPVTDTYFGIKSPQLTNDKKDILGYWEYLGTVIINGDTQEVTPFNAPRSEEGLNWTDFFANKVNNLMFASHWDGQLFDSKTGWISPISYPGLRPWGFTYREHEELYLLGVTQEREEKLVLFNYASGEEIFSFPAHPEMVLLDNTSDGKYYLFATSRDLYLFDEQMFPGRG